MPSPRSLPTAASSERKAATRSHAADLAPDSPQIACPRRPQNARSRSPKTRRSIMDINEFVSWVAAEPARTVTRTIWITPPEVRARAAQAGGLRLTDVLSAASSQAEQRDV